MPPLLRPIVNFLTSLRLTVALLVLATILVFWGTMAQVDAGIYAAQARFFQSFLVWVTIPDTPVTLPVFPGGYLLGTLLLANLIATHLRRFRLRWSQTGIWLTHGGLILLLAGGLFTDLFSRESNLTLNINETKAYSESLRDTELAIIDTTDPKTDRVYAISQDALAAGEPVQAEGLPFTVQIRQYYPNARLAMRPTGERDQTGWAWQGMGDRISVTPVPPTTKMDERNLTTAAVELLDKAGKSLGVWLVSIGLNQPETFTVDGRNFVAQLRPARTYRPYQIQLLNFTHEKYAGTEIPKNFASKVRIINPARHEDREVLIYMNNPLRYLGETFYQASFANDNRTSILQVVRNPNWTLPYISCALMTLGLLVQFSQHLVGFVHHRRPA